MKIEAYVQMSFNEEIELSGTVGEAAFEAASKQTRRVIEVTGAVAGIASDLHIRRRGWRSRPVTGSMMGQPIKGEVTTRNDGLTLSGHAGQEPIHYQLDTHGLCTNHDRDLGIRIVHQAFFSELTGVVDRVPDAAMIGFLLPVLLITKTEI